MWLCLLEDVAVEFLLVILLLTGVLHSNLVTNIYKKNILFSGYVHLREVYT